MDRRVALVLVGVLVGALLGVLTRHCGAPWFVDPPAVPPFGSAHPCECRQ